MKRKLFVTLLTVSLVAASSAVYAEGDVTITLSSTMAEDEDLPEAMESEENQEDGTVSYTISEDKLDDWKEYLKDNWDKTVKDILDDDANYPNVESITNDDDMTEFEITLASTSLSMSEYFIGFLPLFSAPAYQIVNGVAEDDVDYTLTVTDASSGEKKEQSYEDNKKDWESFSASFSTGVSSSAEVAN